RPQERDRRDQRPGRYRRIRADGALWQCPAAGGSDRQPAGAPLMAETIVIVETDADLEWARAAAVAVTPRDYVIGAERFANRHARVINLSGSFDYMELGYYCSLLAEARGQKVVPAVGTILNLSRRTLYADDLPELNATLREEVGKLAQPPRAAFTLAVCFGQCSDSRFRNFAR